MTMLHKHPFIFYLNYLNHTFILFLVF